MTASPRFVVLRVRQLLKFAVPIVAVVIWWWALSLGEAPVMGPTEIVSGRRIIIDPGHGGIDPGAVGYSGTLEKDVVLDIARRLEPLFHRAAVATLMVRDADVELVPKALTGSRQGAELRARVEKANAYGGDAYLSLHANSYPSVRWAGAQTFYYPGDETSKLLAEAIQARLVEAFPQNTRQARSGEYFVLRETSMPAVVIEVGFISNPEEEELLTTAAHQQAIADAIFRGVVDYFLGVDSRNAAHPSAAPVSFDSPSPQGVAEGEFLLYFDAPSNEGDSLVAVVEPFPPSVASNQTLARLEHALKALAKGPPAQSGLLPTMPPGAEVLGVSLEGGRAIVDLGGVAQTRFWGGGQSEERLIESILRTAGQFPDVHEVLLSVEGNSEGTLAGHIDIGRPFPVQIRVRP